MKKGIEIWTDYDRSGRWCLNIKKKKGRFSLDEIRDAAREYELDFYLVFLDCYNEDDPQYGEGTEGDFVTLYRTDLFQEG